MDSPDYPAGRSPRRELQGPRPAPLKVRKDSHKIRKPPVVPQPPQPHPAPPRAPVIIYTVSPKVIHANPNEFMTLVQRLTGPDSTTTYSSSVFASSSSSTSTSTFQDHHGGGAISPAARFASIEKTRSPEGKKPQPYAIDGVDIGSKVERTSPFPGILSPNPSSLPPIPSNLFFPTPSDQNPLSFFTDLSPVLHSNKNYIEGSSLLPSPSTFFSPSMISPNTQSSLDIFNNIFDF